MQEQRTDVFDNLEGKFLARLREISSNTRPTADGKATITFKTARIEANYSPDIIKKIEAGRLIAIPNVMGVNSKDNYSIYEVADVYPMHYSMLTLDRNQPGAIRKEFMTLIEKEWQQGSKSTWIEIVAAPTGYIMQLIAGGREPNFIRKNIAPLTGAEVSLLSDETVRKLICYTPKYAKSVEHNTIGHLLGATDNQVPFTVNIEKLLHYHVGAFAFTGSGKSNLTSLVIRKAMNSVPNVKFVIFDISSEYGVNILDLLRSLPSRIVLTESLPGYGIGGANDNTIAEKMAEDYLVRHVVPEALVEVKKEILKSVKEIIVQDKIRTITIPSESEQMMRQFSTYGGLLRSLAELTNEKFGTAAQKVLIPAVVDMIKNFMKEKKLNEDSLMGAETIPLIKSIMDRLSQAKLRADAALLSIFVNLQLALEELSPQKVVDDDESGYDTTKLVNEILNESTQSPKLFVINLPEADVARYFCTEIIDRIFRNRKSSFTLIPRIVFVFDEAQEFIPADKRKEDGTDNSSRAVERLLRHGRKYNLNGWISTQRIAHLNTNALQQLHSYFVSTMPRPYDRQLISDTFAIDDAFMERTLMFQNGDWLMTSFKATNTQNVPVFFHAINNEGYILD
ncbi:MAG: ATP-binding protein [Candidatus Nitrosopolaris sp.]